MKAKHMVAVDVSLMRTVYMEVEVEEGDDPADLTDDERATACDDACLDSAEDCGASIERVLVLTAEDIAQLTRDGTLKR
jgi:hypothetical protein